MLTAKLNEQFVKDYDLPINIFEEPYFTKRLKLFEPFYHSAANYRQFMDDLQRYSDYENYLDEQTRIQEHAVSDIKMTEAFQRFRNLTRAEIFTATNKTLRINDLFTDQNQGKHFLSITLQDPHFSALWHYDPEIVEHACTWHSFISYYTDDQSIINSKTMPKAIFNACAQKQIIAYENDLMDQLIIQLIDGDMTVEDEVVFLSNDTLILTMSGLNTAHTKTFMERAIRNFVRTCKFTRWDQDNERTLPFKVERFTLYKISNTNGITSGFIKVKTNGMIEFCKFDPNVLPIVIRRLQSQPLEPEDQQFFYNGFKVQFHGAPKLLIPEPVIAALTKGTETEMGDH